MNYELSHNVLIIESLSIIPEGGMEIMMLKSEMKAAIKFLCPVTGHHFGTIAITVSSKGRSQGEALKNVIQAFINCEFYIEIRYYNRVIQCIADTEHIHHIDIQLQDPFKLLFEQLFDLSEWRIPKELSIN